MFFSHFRSLFHKNILILRRNWHGLCLEIAISILCIVALVIFRKVNDKELILEKSYLFSEEYTLYPSLKISNADELYNLSKQIAEKYNFSFPTENSSYYQYQLFNENTTLVNMSNLDSTNRSAFPFDPFSYFKRLLLSPADIPSNIPNPNSFDPNSMSDSDKMAFYNALENVSRTNNIKNCRNPYLGGLIALAPENNITKKLDKLFREVLMMETRFFQDDNDINEYVKSEKYNSREWKNLCFGVTFLSSDRQGGYDYSLRFHQANPIHEVYETNQPWRTHPFKKEWLSKYEKYAFYGFQTLQVWIDNLILQQEMDNPAANVTGSINSVKTPTYYYDDLPGQLTGRSNIFTIIAYVLPFLKLIYYIMYEKERKIKEGMVMMGMSESAFYTSWLLTYFILFLVLSLINSALLKIYIFTFSDYFVIFLIQLLYTLSLMFHGLLITVFFSRSKTAVVAGVFLLFIEYLIVQVVQKESVAYGAKTAASLSPVIAMSLASDLFLEFEATETGITLANLTTRFNNYDVGTALLFFVVNTLMFLVLFLYFEQVFPNEFGKKQSPFFFLKFFCRKRRSKKAPETELASFSLDNIRESPALLLQVEKEEFVEPDSFEKVGNVLLQQKKEKKTVEVKSLTKVFDTGKVAVNDLSFTMYDNQIFVLLGVNGAGKTTTFSMLTGLIPQTSGNVQYFDYDMETDMPEVRKIMGVCPQFDILFDDLTVKEHLELYANIKGMPKCDIPAAVTKMIVDLKLEEKTNYQSKTLSGGQKRKLSTGIAFIGGSKLIFLDEPTTGMDPTNRRVLWDVLKMYKENKIIILTTHFMDEAEYLGDRIGIMGEGVLKCCGSPVFLKNLYGIGYNLTIIKEDSEENPDIFKTINGIVHGCKVLSEASANMVVQLPMEEVGKFKELCETLDLNRKKLKINSYGLSITSLEEVFLKVAQNRDIHESGIKKEAEIENQKQKHQDFTLSDIRLKNKCQLFWGQFVALFLKRINYMKRDWKTLLLEIVLPVFVMTVGIALLYATPIEDPPSLILNPSIYSNRNYIHIKYSGQRAQNFILNGGGLETEFFDSGDNLTAWDQNVYELRTSNQRGSFFINQFDRSIDNYTYHLEANSTSPDSGPILINQMDQMIMRTVLNDPSFKLQVRNYPLGYSETDKENEFLEYQFFTAILVTLAFAFIPGSLVVFFVKERQYKMKHEQMVSGMRSWIYWLANFVFDLPKCLLPVFLSLFIIQWFGVRGLSTDEPWQALWVLFFLYILNIIPFTYFTSFFFEEYGYAQTVTFTVHLMISTVLTLVVGLLRILDNSRDAAKGIAYLFRVIPSFSFGYGTFNIANRKVYAFMEYYYNPKSPYDFDIAGTEMLYLAVTAIIVWVLLIVFELTNEGETISRYFAERKLRKLTYFRAATIGKKKDQDIIDEKERLLKASSEELLLKVVDMKKYFYVPYDEKKIKLAVDSLCLGTAKGECFCLLGVNGAGKTTSFRMLTGEIKPDEGSIHIEGIDAIGNTSQIRDKIGYCPQVDPLLDILSVEEHLYLFAGLKGIPSEMKDRLIEDKMQDLDLMRFRNVSSCRLSGGNKRKLSFAIATLGNPSLIFLDEPSSGMDPESRRFMWNAIAKFSGRNSKNSVILTTHLMEEAEALGTRVGIMVNGSFHCLGNTQYLKNRFGKGYELEIVTEIPSLGDLEALAKKYGMKIGDELTIEQVSVLLNLMGMQEFLNDFKKPEKVGYLFSNKTITFELFAEYIIIEQIGQKVVEFLHKTLGKCEVIEHLYSFFRLNVESINKISHLFGVLENNKSQLNIKYYSIRQTTLEQIFNMFATGQIEDENMEANYPRRASIMPKAPTLSKGISMILAEELKHSSIRKESIANSPEKSFGLLKKMGSIGSLALEDLKQQRSALKRKETKVLNFFSSLIMPERETVEEGKESSSMKEKIFSSVNEESSVAKEDELADVKIFQKIKKDSYENEENKEDEFQK